jgi:ABC-type branched-subunit amino acid transport system ATPase component
MSNNLLSTHGLTKEFGGVLALNSLDVTILAGDIHAIVGPNGAGKTTLINTITGLEQPTAGRILFKGNRIDQLSPELIFEQGISRTFQEGKIVPDLTVLENIMTGFPNRKQHNNIYHNILSKLFPKFNHEYIEREKGAEILKKFDLITLSNRWAEDLVWYERQLVQIARAIASEPQFLLLDEPTAGMDANEKRRIESKLVEINQVGITIMVVSHDIQFIRNIATRITVLDFGQTISEGKPEQVLNDPRVWEAYLGTK